MSGVEVAGLVLAVIPLVVAGIDSYSDGVRTIRKIRHCIEELEDMRDDLELEHEKFRITVEFLLRDSVDDQTLQMLFDDIGGKLWADEYIEKCFHGRLQRAYAIFWKSVRSMDKSLRELKRGLDLDIKKNPILGRLKRIAVGFKLKDYRALVDKVQKSNWHIDNLVHRSIEVLPIRELRRKYPDFNATRQCASSAFQALQTSLSVSCHDEHHASVFLRSVSPKVLTGQESKNDHEEVTHLTVILRYSTTSGAQSVLEWRTEELEIRPVEGGQPGTRRGPLQQMIRTRLQNGKLSTFRHQIAAIRDLCSSIERIQTRVAGVCLGYLPGHPSPQSQGLHWPITPLTGQSAAWQRLTFAELLVLGEASGLNESNKRRLALLIATGLMRMHDTPWIRGLWGRHEIIVQRAGTVIATDHALITTELQKSGVGANTQPRASYFQSCELIGNEELFALGLLLIELSLEKPFQELRTQKDLAQAGHQFTDFLAAKRALNVVYAKAGNRYGDVVRRCLECSFGGSSKRQSSLRDAGFKKVVYNNMVQELEREVEDACR